MSSIVAVPFTTTLLVRDTCLCLHAQRAARVLARRFDEALRPVGLTNGQFSLMMSLNRPEGCGIPPATMKSVADLLGMDRTTLTAAVKTLERRGLVQTHVDPKDRRGRGSDAAGFDGAGRDGKQGPGNRDQGLEKQQRIPCDCINRKAPMDSRD